MISVTFDSNVWRIVGDPDKFSKKILNFRHFKKFIKHLKSGK